MMNPYVVNGCETEYKLFRIPLIELRDSISVAEKLITIIGRWFS